MKELTITISGQAGHGKTVLAKHLATYLAHNIGFDVTLIDEGRPAAVPDENDMPSDFNAKVTLITKEI